VNTENISLIIWCKLIKGDKDFRKDIKALQNPHSQTQSVHVLFTDMHRHLFSFYFMLLHVYFFRKSVRK
jgi:hypothetical protein